MEQNSTLLICAIVAAFAGAWLGSKLLKKVTLAFVQYTVSILVFVLSVALAAGVI